MDSLVAFHAKGFKSGWVLVSFIDSWCPRNSPISLTIGAIAPERQPYIILTTSHPFTPCAAGKVTKMELWDLTSATCEYQLHNTWQPWEVLDCPTLRCCSVLDRMPKWLLISFTPGFLDLTRSIGCLSALSFQDCRLLVLLYGFPMFRNNLIS